MELNYIISIIDRKKMDQMSELYAESGIQLDHSALCHGSTKSRIIDRYGIEATDKGIIYGLGNRQATKEIIRQATEKFLIDVPGNGLLITVPIKSIKGGRTLAYVTNNKINKNEKVKTTSFNHELIVVILNEGYIDNVMDAARGAGASGGTVLHAKGTGSKKAKQFFGVSLANERDIIYIVAESKIKADIMNAIDKECGMQTEAGAICFSLPVSNVVGLRNWRKYNIKQKDEK